METRTKLATLAIVALLAVSLATPVAAQSRKGVRPHTKAAPGPEAIVATLYRDHFKLKQEWGATLASPRDRFAPELLALIDESERLQAATPDEVVGLDFNPLTDSQDAATKYEVANVSRDGADTIVTVEVKLGPDRRDVRVRLVGAGDSWRIANVHYQETDLVTILREITKAPAAP